jgi:hypothetical protein
MDVITAAVVTTLVVTNRRLLRFGIRLLYHPVGGYSPEFLAESPENIHSLVMENKALKDRLASGSLPPQQYQSSKLDGTVAGGRYANSDPVGPSRAYDSGSNQNSFVNPWRIE